MSWLALTGPQWWTSSSGTLSSPAAGLTISDCSSTCSTTKHKLIITLFGTSYTRKWSVFLTMMILCSIKNRFKLRSTLMLKTSHKNAFIMMRQRRFILFIVRGSRSKSTQKI
jgi:hypothetical protein